MEIPSGITHQISYDFLPALVSPFDITFIVAISPDATLCK